MSITALTRDWDRLTPVVDAAVPGWAARRAALARCRTATDVLRAGARTPGALAALLAEDRAGCAYAARTALQALLPRVVDAAEPGVTTEDLAAELWLVLRQQPPGETPGLADALVARAQAEVRAQRQPAPALVATPSADDLRARRVLRAARELGLIDDPTHDVLAGVYAEARTSREVAARHGSTPAAVRQRCSVAVRRLAAHREALLAAA